MEITIKGSAREIAALAERLLGKGKEVPEAEDAWISEAMKSVRIEDAPATVPIGEGIFCGGTTIFYPRNVWRIAMGIGDQRQADAEAALRRVVRRVREPGTNWLKYRREKSIHALLIAKPEIEKAEDFDEAMKGEPLMCANRVLPSDVDVLEAWLKAPRGAIARLFEEAAELQAEELNGGTSK